MAISRRLLLALGLVPQGHGLLLLAVSDGPDEARDIAAQLVAATHLTNIAHSLNELDLRAVNVLDARAWTDEDYRAANLARPRIAAVRVVLVLGMGQVERFRMLAPDLFDWISHADGLG